MHDSTNLHVSISSHSVKFTIVHSSDIKNYGGIIVLTKNWLLSIILLNILFIFWYLLIYYYLLKEGEFIQVV